MSIPYEAAGRTRQKLRTRAAMLAATRALLTEGVTSPTVEQAADRAQVSRTTAYRYFPNQHALLLATYPALEAKSLLGDAPPDDPIGRLDVVTASIARQLVDHEAEFRTMLRLSLEAPLGRAPDLVLRQGRAIGWIEDALAPLRPRLPVAEVRRIAVAIRATMGIESLVWLTDVAGVPQKEALATMRRSARAILRCALADAGIANVADHQRRPTRRR
jgi:AcrR family transcriptional regulator